MTLSSALGRAMAIFEALAVLGGPGKVVLVISPLKALERDQVCILLSPVKELTV